MLLLMLIGGAPPIVVRPTLTAIDAPPVLAATQPAIKVNAQIPTLSLSGKIA